MSKVNDFSLQSYFTNQVLAALLDLYFKADILHRDVSLWNLMLKINKMCPKANKEILCQGLLIDLDYAKLRYYLQQSELDWDFANRTFVFPEL